MALQKAKAVLATGARVHVIAPQVEDELKILAKTSSLFLHFRSYQDSDFEQAALVFGAALDLSENARLHAICQHLKIWFNAVDQPEECDFIIPAQINRGDLQISISTAGKAPFLAKKIRQQLEEVIGPEYAEVLEVLAHLRGFFHENGRKSELTGTINAHWDLILKAIRQKDASFFENTFYGFNPF